MLDVDGEIVAHAAVVERELWMDDRPLRTGYVEAVATTPERQGQGLGSLVMGEVNAIVRDGFELGALGTGSNGFYERLGWVTWLGPTFVRTADGRSERRMRTAGSWCSRRRRRHQWTSTPRSAASGAPATSGSGQRSSAPSAQGISGGGVNVEAIWIVAPPSAIDAAAPSRMSTTWAACSALARCGRPSAIDAAISATPRAQAMPWNAGRTGATGS